MFICRRCREGGNSVSYDVSRWGKRMRLRLRGNDRILLRLPT